MISKEMYVDRIVNFSGIEVGAALLERISDSLMSNLIHKPVQIFSIYPNIQYDARHLVLEKQITTGNMQNLPLICRKEITSLENSFTFYAVVMASEAGMLYYLMGQYENNSWLFLENYFMSIFSTNREYVETKITEIDNSISLLY